MARVCRRHPFILSENLCGRCGDEFCRECLVFPRGQKLPLCTDCAIAASGVRAQSAPGLKKREIRARAKARARELREQAPKPLPQIANPVPTGWALGESGELPAGGAPSRRRKHRDAPGRAPEAARRDTSTKGAAESGDMMSWLDSVYKVDRADTSD